MLEDKYEKKIAMFNKAMQTKDQTLEQLTT